MVFFLTLALLTSQTPTAPAPSRAELFKKNGIIWGSRAAWGTPYKANLDADEKVAGLARFWMEVKINFPGFERMPDMDWDKVFVQYVPKVRATKSTFEYYRVLQEMCSLLQDGHSNVFMPAEASAAYLAPVPVQTDLIEDHVFITRVNSPKLASKGVSEGLEILKVDGMPVHEFVEKFRKPYISSNSPQHRNVLWYGDLLSGPKGKPAVVEVKDKGGKIFPIKLARGVYDDVTSRPTFEVKPLQDNTVYLAINTFAAENMLADFIKLVPEIKKYDGLIIDVRENEGGSGYFAYNMLDYLTDKPYDPGRWKSRSYIPTYRAWGNSPGDWFISKGGLEEVKAAEAYTKPIVMLTGPRALSATDVFVDAFARMHRGSIVGEPTGGSSGDPVAFALPGGGAARISTSLVVDSDFLGKGVIPDILAPRKASDFIAGKDACLEAGVAELLRLMKKAHQPVAHAR